MKNSTEEKEKEREHRKFKFTLSKSKYVYMKVKMYVFVFVFICCEGYSRPPTFSQRQTDGMRRDDDVQGQHHGMYEENVWISGYGDLGV